MEKLNYVYPGRFCPPTIGHANIVARAAAVFSNVTIICSTNPDKTNDIFKPEESEKLWQAYDIPSNVKISTFEEFVSRPRDNSKTVIIRGIRNYADLADEQKVMSINKNKFGIDKYFYFVSEDGLEHISASTTRELAMNLELEKLAEYISPLIISRLLERSLGINNLFMVVGRPGAGKSTFLKLLERESPMNHFINTDDFNKAMKPYLLKAFGDDDLVRVALERKEELAEAIKEPWMNMLREALRNAPKNSNVFVEVPFGLQPDKSMFRFLGGKVINLFCEEREHVRRLRERGTPQHIPFIQAIPDKNESVRIARLNHLDLVNINTFTDMNTLADEAKKFAYAMGR